MVMIVNNSFRLSMNRNRVTIRTMMCQPIDQNIDFSDFDQIQTPQYPDVHPLSQEKSNEVFQANHFVQYKENLENSLNTNQEKEGPPQDSDIRHLIREECCVEASEEQKQSMEDTMLELVKICQEKEFLCIHDNVDDLIESALNSKLLLINSNFQRLDKKNITPKTESDEVTESNAENLLPIPSECEVTSEDESKCDVPISENSPVCVNHYEILSDSKIDDDISVYDDDFEDIEYVEASLSDPEIVSIEEENVVHQVIQQEEEEFDLEEISQIQDVVLREKLLSITRLISNIESLNDNSTPDRVLTSFDNSLSDNFSPEFKTFCDHSEETRSGNTTHADNSLSEYDSFCFKIEPDQERLIYLVTNDISDNSSNDPFLEEADLFLAFDNLIPPGIENVVDNSEGDVRFLEELLINDSILSHESSNSNFEDNPSISLPPPKPPDEEFDFEIDFGDEISVVRNTIVRFECIDARMKFDVFNDENNDYSYFLFDKVFSLLSAESEDTIFDPEKIGEDLARINLDIILVYKNTTSSVNWHHIIENFPKKLTSWKAKTLSYGGRLNLIKSVLGVLVVEALGLVHYKLLTLRCSPNSGGVSTRKETHFGKRCTSSNGHSSYVWAWRRNPHDGLEMEKFNELVGMIINVNLNQVPDAWECNVDSSKVYHVISMRKIIEEKMLPSLEENIRWNKSIPIKINLHTW
uniref:Reverse transcriptase domain, reverse transcriptase zinc-binding domain protein n=1 Tax=Tanacetum cinerariifolium TaxID=118510 RepID=A0A6L2KX84_TANCI|nr:reverse transcriptase domain, reverse transcriptase zinc-binding domain protein [Tanacetum cinerariifolium]